MRSSYIFVYGTLRAKVKESQHTLIKQYTQYVGIGFVYGSLYNISWYPGVVLDKKSKKESMEKSIVLRELFTIN